MKLSASDAKLFYDLLWSLQFFVNQRLNVIANVATLEDYRQASQADKAKVREALFNHPSLIVTFVEENPANLPPDQLSIVSEWQYFVKDEFYIERYLKTHAIFIGKQVYGVLGLTESIEDIIPKQRLPFLVKTVLLPFKGCIVYDGLFEAGNVYFGSGIKADLKDHYQQAKQKDRIILTLSNKAIPASKRIKVKPKPPAIADWSEELNALTHISGKLRGGSGQQSINSSVFSLVKASVALANTAVTSPSDLNALYKAIKKAEHSLVQVEKTFYRIEEGE